MKKFLILFLAFFIGANAMADTIILGSDVTMKNFWEKFGKEQQKLNEVTAQVVNANKLDKRIVIVYDKSDTINACSWTMRKYITVYKGLMTYVDNDDEMAAIVAHEISHTLDAYKGAGYVVGTYFNRKSYEFKSDLRGIDMMVKAGYNPIAMITVMNKMSPESFWDFGVLMSHPKTSRRLMEDFKYIYIKYPQFLQSDMAKNNVYYQNWTYTAQEEIKAFYLKEQLRKNRRGAL